MVLVGSEPPTLVHLIAAHAYPGAQVTLNRRRH